MLFLPLISFFVICFFSYYFGRSGSLVFSIINISIINIFSLCIFFFVLLNNFSLNLYISGWIYLLTFDASWLFNIDILSISMSYVITLISLFVHLYSVDYMYGDPNRSLFLGYLSLFTFFMLLLVCSANLFVFFLSWEGVGICSYLLINFWNTRVLATQSALKALLVNRVSDLFLFIGLLEVSIFINSVNINLMEICNPLCGVDLVNLGNIRGLCCLFLFIGVVGKSAQLFLHTWLPDAMEGPTPVSALLHAATMVTAGIFLFLRFSFIFDSYQFILQAAGILGACTIIVSGTIGLFQFDVKKVIAYSTCSQLGYMLVACSASVYFVSLYHFTVHAFFKALLFLLSGCIIHSFSNEQDMRKYGGLLFAFPLSCILFIIGTSALVAEPFLSGYYSKELIIFSLNDVYISVFSFVYWVALYGAVLTILYSFRSLWLVFFSQIRSSFNIIIGFYDLHYIILYILVILGLFSIFSGYLFSSLYRDGSFYLNFGASYNHFLLNHYVYDFLLYEHNYLAFYSNVLIIILFIVYIYIRSLVFSTRYSVIRCFFLNRWFFDFIYNRLLALVTLVCSENFFYKYIDKGYIEVLGPMGLYNSIYYTTKVLNLKTYSTYIDILYIISYVGILIIILLFSYYGIIVIDE